MTRTRRAWWSRSDQAGLEALLYASLGVGALSLVPRVVAAVRGEPIELTTPLPEELVRPAAGIEAPLSGTVVLAEPSAGQQVLALLPPVLTVAVVAVGALLLLGVVRALREGDPFTLGSVRRLRWLALLVTGGGLGAQLVSDLVRNRLVADSGVVDGLLGATFGLALWPVVAGFLIAFVAEVLARGTTLRAEVEGLV